MKGWTVEDLTPERHFLYSLVRMYQPERMIEIGVSEGFSTTAIALAMKKNCKGKLTAVDNWSRRHGGMAANEGKAAELLKASGVRGQVEFVKSDSQKFLKSRAANSHEVVWVDGDHSHKGATDDTLEALRIATKLVIVHDTENLRPVKRAMFDLEAASCAPNSPMPYVIDGYFIRAFRGFWLCDVRPHERPEGEHPIHG